MKAQEPPISVHFTIKRKALLYDIENQAYLLGNLLGEDMQPTKHQLIDVAQEGNVDIIARAFDLAYSECQSFLFPYLKEPIKDGEIGDDMLVDAETYEFTLCMPSTFASSSAMHLKKLIHEYMICRAMVEWLGINYPQLKVEWEIKMERAKSDIRSCLNVRCKRVRRNLHPF